MTRPIQRSGSGVSPADTQFCPSSPSTSCPSLRVRAQAENTCSSTSIPDSGQEELTSSWQSSSSNRNFAVSCAQIPPSPLTKTVVKQMHNNCDKDENDDHDDFLENKSLLLHKSTDSSARATGLEESDYYSERYDAGGIRTATFVRKHGNSDDNEMGMGMMKAAVGALQLLKHENNEVNDTMIEYLPQTAALLLSALQGSEITALEKSVHNNNSNDENKGDEETKRYTASLYENLQLPLSEILSSNPQHTPHVMVEEMESTERKADALYESIVNMDGSYSQKLSPKSRERKDCSAAGNGASHETSIFLNNDSEISDDENSIQEDIARLSQSITHLQQDLDSTDFSFLDDLYNNELGDEMSDNRTDHHWNRCWNDNLIGLKMWLSRNSIVEQKLLRTLLIASIPNNAVVCSILLKVAMLFVMIQLLLRISVLADRGSSNSIDDQTQLADIVDWWLFQ